MKIRLCLVALCCLMFQSSAAYGQNQTWANWEYRFVNNYDVEMLNRLGKEGWELVSFAIDPNSEYKLIMKRPNTHPSFGTKTEEYPKPEPPPPNTVCKLTRAQAPVIRGLRLGMTSDELFALFPANEREVFDRSQRLKSDERAPNYGSTLFNFNPSDYATQDRYKGINGFSFLLFDGKVVSIYAGYSNVPQFDGMDQLMAVVTKQYNLPDYKEWPRRSQYFGSQSISCDGFNVQVNGGSNNLSIAVLDPS